MQILAMLFVFVLSNAAAEFAWQDAETYRPPDFEGTFAADEAGTKRLEKALRAAERGESPGEDIFEIMRAGLRGMKDRQMPALRWFGNQFIWNKSPQHPRAIDLMYHASASTNSSISYNAIYFGLSVVRPKTEPILRAMVEAGMKTEDPNTLGRIAWGASSNQASLLKYLEPFLKSEDEAKRKHAEELRKIFGGEIEAFAWSTARAKKRASEIYSGRLEEFRDGLVKGDSAKRRETIDTIQRESIALIMDDTFISAFAEAAKDHDEDIRRFVAVTVGSRWIWHGGEQAKAAIDLMVNLSRDESPQVRYAAVYFGLSTIRNYDKEVVDRLLEIVRQDARDGSLRGRILWGFRNNPEAKARAEDAIKAAGVPAR